VGDVYCTSFCNKGHRISDGKPVGHECYVLRPQALKAEADGDVERALEIGIRTERVHKGVKGP
jgi:hypothetical protein